MADTLISMAREVQLYSPGVPIQLAQRWIRNRYRSLCERYLWSFKLGEGSFSTPASSTTGSVTLTNNSATVAGSGTSWDSTLINQQLYVNGVVFNISAVGSTTSLTIDTAWQFATSSGTSYTIARGYLTPTESDFQSFVSCIDPYNGWRLRLGFNSKEIDRFDPRRSSRGTPYIIASRTYSSTGIARFELWPVPSTQSQYRYIYEKRVADLSAATDTPANIIRGDILVKGALADLARWPGTENYKNPLYDLGQWRVREDEFKIEVANAQQADQNIYLSDIIYDEGKAYPPLDSNFIQSHGF